MPAARENGDPDHPDWLANRQRSVRIHAAGLARFAARLRRELAGGREFAVCIASDEAVRRANRRFRGRGRTTDVLSFPDGEGGRLGDILISARRARVQSRRLGHSVDEEIRILILHGLLHLLGYDHERDRGEMRRLERRWRRRLGLPAGLIERVRP
jgi:probable rRNA maturation factor